MPFETSCMPSLKRVGTLYWESGGTPLHQKFHHEPISTCLEKTRFFITDVVVINLMWEIVASSVISRPAGATTKLNAIVKIRKHKGFYERHQFILMATKVHGAHGCDIDCFIRECAYFSHNRWSRGHLSLSFCINFFR
jgi:hypothetical protein